MRCVRVCVCVCARADIYTSTILAIKLFSSILFYFLTVALLGRPLSFYTKNTHLKFVLLFSNFHFLCILVVFYMLIIFGIYNG